MRELRISSLQWAVGVFCALIGALLLVVPHQFESPVETGLGLNLPWWGASFLLAGWILVGIAALSHRMRRSLVFAAHFPAGAGLLLIAGTTFSAYDWIDTAIYTVLGLGTMLAPLLVRDPRAAGAEERPGAGHADAPDGFAGKRAPAATATGDLLALIMGLGSCLAGLLLLAFPGHFAEPVVAWIRPFLPLYGVAFLTSGAALVYLQLRPNLPSVVWWGVHLFAAAVLFAFLVVLPLPSHEWLDVAYYGGFGLVLVLLPRYRGLAHPIAPSSLRTQLAIALAAAAALPLVAVAAMVTDVYQRSATAEALTLQDALASALAQDVSDYIDLHSQAVDGVALQPGLWEMDYPEKRAFLHAVKPAYRDLIHLSVFDATGEDTADSDDIHRPNASQRFVFLNAREKMAPTLDMFIGPITGTPIFAFGSPYRDASGQFAGIVGSSVESTRVAAMLASASTGDGREAYLVDARARMVAHPDASLAAALADFSAAPPIAAMQADGNDHGALRYSTPDGERLAGYARVPRLGWGVVVEQPTATALAGARAGRELAFWILLVTIALATAGGALAAGGLVGPLNALARAVERFAGGNPAAPLPRSRVSEVARLATVFGQMRDRLAARTAERELAEEALRESEERYRRIVETAQEGIWIIDINNRTAFANRKMAEMLGYTADEMVGSPLDAFLDESAKVAAAAEVKRRRQGLKKRHDTELRRKDGTTLWAIVSKNAMFDREARYTGTLWMVTDITDRKHAEEERAQLLAREHATRQRLEESNRQLARATQTKSEFLATMSHELRTPLNSIIGFSELLLDDPGDGPAPSARQRFVSNILQSGRHLLGLVNDILDLTKVEAGRMELRPATFELAASLRAVEAAIRPLAEKKGLTLVTRVSPKISNIYADEGKFKQVLYNLLSNAVKFTPEGGQVQTTARLAHGLIRVTVSDTGIGIAGEDQERIFEAFQQLDSSSARRHEGTGLGLALAQRLVELQGGRIWVESEPGKGSSFGFTVPLRVGPAPQPAGLISPADGEETGSDRPLVLVVEADLGARELLRTHLEQGGYRVAAVADQHSAVEQARVLQPAAITLDVLLAGPEGWDVLRSLKADEVTAAIPVVVMSMEDDPHRGYALGAAAYLVKPVERGEPVQTLKRLGIDSGEGAREAVVVADDKLVVGERVSAVVELHDYRALRREDGERA
jgi:PAS domain S-box-containing protein